MAGRCPRSLPRAGMLAASGAPRSHPGAWGSIHAASWGGAAAVAPGAELAWSEAPPLFLPVSSRGRGGAQAEAVVSPGHTLDGSQSRVRARQRSWGPAQAWAVGTPVGSHHPPPMGSPIPPWDLPCTRGPGQGGDVLSAHRGPAAGAGGWNPRLHWPGAVNAATPSASTSVSQRRSSSRGRGGRAGGARGGRGGAGRGGGGGRGAERGGRDGSSRGRGEQHSTGMRREEQAEREAGFWRAEGRPEPEPHARAREVAQGRGRGEDSAGVPLQSPTTSSSSPSPSRSSREGIIARVAREQGVPRVHLKRGKAGLFRGGGSPFVFSGAVDCVVGRPPPEAGATVALADGEGAVFAWGVFNPHSMYRVRVMQTEADAARFPDLVLDMPALIAQRLRAAADLRSRFGLTVSPPALEAHGSPLVTPVSPVSDSRDHSPSPTDLEVRLDAAGAAGKGMGLAEGGMAMGHAAGVPQGGNAGGMASEGAGATVRADRGSQGAASGVPTPQGAPCDTTVFRLVNSEGDRLSGLVVDVFGGLVVVSSSAAWAEAYRGHITACLIALMRPSAQGPSPLFPQPGLRPSPPGTPAAATAAGVPWAENEHDGGAQSLVVWRPSVDMLKEEGWGIDVGVGTPHKADTDTPPEAESERTRAEAELGASILEGEAVSGPQELAAVEGQALVHPGSTGEIGLSALGGEAEAGRGTPSAISSPDEGTPREDLTGPAARSSAGSEDPAIVEVLEHGLRFVVDLRGGQKTGFYADQRDSRLLIRQAVAAQCQAVTAQSDEPLTLPGAPGDHSRTPSGSARRQHDGVRVLDLCCYTGGFALSAAAAGALVSVGVDSSASALALAVRNRERNGISEHQCQFVKADIVEYMASSLAAKEQWDVVILDPPKLAPSRKALARALPRYRRLNVAAMRLLAPGGLLMTCSCSGAVTQSGAFLPVLQEAAVAAQRRITVLRTAGPGIDHPLDPACPEGAYLTNVLLRVD